MSLAILLLAVLQPPTPAAPAAAAPSPVEDEIVVMARKMQLIEVDIKAPKRHGKLVIDRCRITTSSGYAELDAIPCDSARQCLGRDPANRKALERCVETVSNDKLDAIFEARRAAAAKDVLR